MEAWFPTLKVFRCTMRRITGITESQTLQELDLPDYKTGLAREGVDVTFGNFPRLEILRLHVRLVVEEVNSAAFLHGMDNWSIEAFKVQIELSEPNSSTVSINRSQSSYRPEEMVRLMTKWRC